MESLENEAESPLEEQIADTSISSRSEQSQDSQEDVDSEPKEKLLKLPLGRVKHIVKSDPDVNLINQEAIFLITKSAKLREMEKFSWIPFLERKIRATKKELFIDSISKEAYKYTVQAKKKTVQKKDLEQAIDHVDSLAFLEGMLEQLV